MLLHDDVQSFSLERVRISPDFLQYICDWEYKRIELEECKYRTEEKIERTYSH